MKTINLFLSSPGDCVDERDAVHSIVQQINQDFFSTRIQINVIAWDAGHGIPLEALASPQISVNQHMLTPENCEIFIGIFKIKFGSPINDKQLRKENGDIFYSGTEYEFDRAWKARRRGAHYPEIFIYRNDTNLSSNLSKEEQEHIERLNTFFSSPPFQENNTWLGSVNKFKDSCDFKQKINAHLRQVLMQYVASHGIRINKLIEDKMKAIVTDAGPRYTGDVHVDSNINLVFEWLLASNSAIKQLDETLANCWKAILTLPLKEQKEFKDSMYSLGESLSQNKFIGSGITQNELAILLKNFHTICKKYIAIYKEKEKSDQDDIKPIINNFYVVKDTFDEISNLLNQFGNYAEKRIILLTGAAGLGKTHTIVHQVTKIVQEGKIAIGVFCQTLSSSTTLETAISEKISPTHTFDEILDALENAAAEKNTRALIAIDALNETPNRKRWRFQLMGILKKILSRPHLTAVLSVRNDYRDDVLPNTSKDQVLWAEVDHPGFSNIEPEALQAYCSYYKTKVPLAPFVGEVSNPLYLQMLVKALASKEEILHYFPSWLDVWENWQQRLEDDAKDKLDIEPSRNLPIKRSLLQIANAMIDNNTFILERSQADDITEKISGSKGVVEFFCSSGVLMSMLDENVDYIIFAFERLTETFITDALLKRIFAGCSTEDEKKEAFLSSVNKSGLLSFLYTNDTKTNYYNLRYGFLRALCIAAPAQIKAELPDILSSNFINKSDDREQNIFNVHLSQAFLDSLNWRSTPEEFGCLGNKLLNLYLIHSQRHHHFKKIDNQILYAMLPEHPVGKVLDLHNNLMNKETPGERDALWTTHITELWFQDHCSLRSLMQWAMKTDLKGVSINTALPAARLLLWSCAVSQKEMRLQAMQSLTIILANSPECGPLLLHDFLSCNDAYIVEALLIGVWGMVQYVDNKHAVDSAKIIYRSIFKKHTPTWCHITIRHYARKIIEHVLKEAVIKEINIEHITPPYKSHIPLDKVPTKRQLEELDHSRGYFSIMRSALHHNFFWYVMGGTSGGKPFLSKPLPGSQEPERSYDKEDYLSAGGVRPGIFDIPLAARFVVYNCLQLGWTASRFDAFEEVVEGMSRYSNNDSGRTERIGKKYQWISWHTMLAFLSDNYTMNPYYREGKIYDSPSQIGYITLYDPLKWLSRSRYSPKSIDNLFWNISGKLRWPLPQMNKMLEWADSLSADLNPSDVIMSCPAPSTWEEGHWLLLYGEHVWQQNELPGQWRRNKNFMADIWLQIVPRLIWKEDLPILIKKMEHKTNQEAVQWGNICLPEKWKCTISEWQGLTDELEQEIHLENDPDAWLPVPSMSMLGQLSLSGDDMSLTLPLPRLFKDWNLTLDIETSSIKHANKTIFGITSLLGKDAVIVHTQSLMKFLAQSGYSLVWLVRGERRAFLHDDLSMNNKEFVWNDYHYLLYLGVDGRPNGMWQSRRQEHRAVTPE